MINCIIVDDEPLSQQLLKEYAGRNQELRLVKLCSNALEAFDIIHKETIDLIFLDIQMPSMTGINFIRSLKNPPAVIFVTAFPEHAVMSYELNAVDYLLKPVTYERFTISISKFLKQHIEHEPPPDYSYFKVDGRMVKLMHKDILYAQSMKDYMIIRTTNRNYITHMTMKYLAGLLPEKLFKRVHRSFLIGTSHITSIGRNEIMIGEAQIPIGESYKEEVNKLNISMK
jgi:two-component system LytT family response regulator